MLGRVTTSIVLGKGRLSSGTPLPPFDAPAGFAIDGPWLLASPNIGHVVCLGRFDGKLRWLHPYPTVDFGVGAVARPGMMRPQPGNFAAMQPDVLQRATGPRWDNRPRVAGADGAVIVAPADSESTFALDSRTGRMVWESDAFAADTLIGSSGNVAVFAGSQLTGIDTATGKPRWTFNAPGDQPIVGPSAICGGTVFVPISGELRPIAVDTGEPMHPRTAPIDFQSIVGGEGRAVLSPEALETFTLPMESRRRLR
jgi:outer membrane protein assembly factor BamB